MRVVHAKQSPLARYVLAGPLRQDFARSLVGERSPALEYAISEFKDGQEHVPQFPEEFAGRSTHFCAGYLSNYLPEDNIDGTGPDIASRIGAALKRRRDRAFYDAALAAYGAW